MGSLYTVKSVEDNSTTTAGLGCLLEHDTTGLETNVLF